MARSASEGRYETTWYWLLLDPDVLALRCDVRPALQKASLPSCERCFLYLICQLELTLIRDRSQVPLDNEDANEDEVEEDGEGEHDPGEDSPRVPRPRLVILLLLLYDGVLRGPLVQVVVVDLDHG